MLIRGAHILSAGFPLNDGGLFYRMTEDIQAAHYRLPPFTTYNDAAIPLAYSPLAFYLAAAINGLTGIPLIELFRFLPLLATSLTVVAFYHLARGVLRDDAATAAATFAFAIVPRSYVWLLMGGGLTRSFGFLLAVVALQQVHQLYTRREWRYAATTTVACALTVVTHLSTAQFLAVSIALFFLFHGRHRHGLVSSLAIAAGTVLLTAPWWGVVIAQHGLAPFLAAQTVSGSVVGDRLVRYEVLQRLARFNTGITGEPFFPVIGALGVLGACLSLRPGRILLPIWWVLITVLDPRAGETYATLPLAMLAGIAVVQVLIPALRSFYGGAGDPAPGARRHPLLRFVPGLVLGGLIGYSVLAGLTHNGDYGGETAFLTALTPADLDAMRWVEQHTPPASRFAVITGEQWSRDKVAEWFPALTRRTSVGTVQGLEWLPGFTRRGQLSDELLQRRCPSAGVSCLTTWADSAGRDFRYVYVVNRAAFPCCAPLITALRRDPDYRVVYDGTAAVIAERR